MKILILIIIKIIIKNSKLNYLWEIKITKGFVRIILLPIDHKTHIQNKYTKLHDMHVVHINERHKS